MPDRNTGTSAFRPIGRSAPLSQVGFAPVLMAGKYHAVARKAMAESGLAAEAAPGKFREMAQVEKPRAHGNNLPAAACNHEPGKSN